MVESELLREALERNRQVEKQKLAARLALIHDVQEANRVNLEEKQRLMRMSLEREKYENERIEEERRLDQERARFEQKMKQNWVNQVNLNNRLLAEEIKRGNYEKQLEDRRRAINDAQLPDAHLINTLEHYDKVRQSHPSKLNAYRQGQLEFDSQADDFKRGMEALYRQDISAMVAVVDAAKRQADDEL